MFLELPSRSDYADYYKLITNPIAMDMIQHRINSPYYQSIEHFAQDFEMMFANAMTYNVEGSDVYTDAVVLKSTFQQTLANLINNRPKAPPRIIEDDEE